MSILADRAWVMEDFSAAAGFWLDDDLGDQLVGRFPSGKAVPTAWFRLWQCWDGLISLNSLLFWLRGFDGFDRVRGCGRWVLVG
jgi:hypothetical protein